jgi:hypothetical protein
MINFTYPTGIELDLAYCYTADVEVTISNNNASFYGSALYDDYDVEVILEAEELVEQLSPDERAELKQALGVADNNEEPTVDSIYESMSEGQRAHMFNKLLKNVDYNAGSVSLERVGTLLIDIHNAKNGINHI